MQYSFSIKGGPLLTSILPGNQEARKVATSMFADLARDIARTLEASPEWQIEVADGSGKPIFRLSVLAETFE
jgi:hypothetical protein